MLCAAASDSRCVQIKEYCFEEDGFTDTFNEWSAQNAHNIDLTMDFTENKLEYTEMHREVRLGMLQLVTKLTTNRAACAVHCAV